MLDFLNKVLYHGIWVDFKSPITEGGKECYMEMDNNFRTLSHISSLIFTICMLFYGSNRFKNKLQH